VALREVQKTTGKHPFVEKRKPGTQDFTEPHLGLQKPLKPSFNTTGDRGQLTQQLNPL